MITFAIAWLLLMIVFSVIGYGILLLLRSDLIRQNQPEQFLLSQCLGIIIFTNCLLFSSIFNAVTPLVGGIVLLPFFIIFAANKGFEVLRNIYSGAFQRHIVVVGIVLLTIAYIFSREATLVDTGLYHFQLIKWLSEYGSVKGLALLHHRFGFTSSWFTLPALFNHGFLQNRSASIGNGYLILTLCCYIVFCLLDQRNSFPRFSRPFLIFFSFFLVLTFSIPIRRFLTSASTDVPTAFFCGICCWFILLIEDMKAEADPSEEFNKLDKLIILAILATGTLSIKISAIPVTLCCFIYILKNIQFNAINIKLLVLPSVIIALAIPTLAVSKITSGCPLFPSSLGCSGSASAYEVVSGNYDFSSFYDSKPFSYQKLTVGLNRSRWEMDRSEFDRLRRSYIQNVDIYNLAQWNPIDALLHGKLRERYVLIVGLIIILVSCILLASLKVSIGGISYVIFVIFSGITYVLHLSPSTRFLNGYLASGLALSCTILGFLLVSRYPGVTTWLQRYKTLAIVLFLLVPISLSLALFGLGKGSVLLPVALETSPKLIIVRSGSLRFYRPVADLCWAAPLPCTPENIEGKVGLRHPEKGLAGGFVRLETGP